MKMLTVIGRWWVGAVLLTLLSACGPDNDNSSPSPSPSTESFTVTASTGSGGNISPASQTVDIGETAIFTLTGDSGFFASVSGCDGRLSQDSHDMDSNSYTYTYTTGAIDADCSVSAVFSEPSTPALSFAPVKLLHFEWADNSTATHYRLKENPDGMSGFTQVGGDIEPKVEAFDHQVPLYARINAQYMLESCVDSDCYPSATVSVSGTLADSIGYVKAGTGNTGRSAAFGVSVSLNSTGDTMAVGANGQDDNVGNSGAVYVFTRDDTSNIWSQQAYIKASNPGRDDEFGASVSLDNTGDTLAVGVPYEDSSDHDDDLDNQAENSGAVYVFTRDGTNNIWSQQAYIKAGDIDQGNLFGRSVSLNGAGDTLAVGAHWEDSAATGINPLAEERDDDCDLLSDSDPTTIPTKCAPQSGAVYVYTREDADINQPWHQLAYIKASNAEGKDFDCGNANICNANGDEFGWSVSLNDTGDILAVGAIQEDSNTAGVDNYINGMGDPDFYKGNAYDLPGNRPAHYGYGSVYIFTRDGSNEWSEQAYIKGSRPVDQQLFGYSVSLNGAGDTLAVGGTRESSGGIRFTGAAYVFIRDASGWSEQAFIKATHPGYHDFFGASVSLSGSGDTLAVSTHDEDGTATGIHGEGNNDCTADPKSDSCAFESGAVYVFTRDGTTWNQQAYIKAGNAEAGDLFGRSVSLDDTGDTLAVGANREDSAATGIGGEQQEDCTTPSGANCAEWSGAVYLY